MWTIKIYKLLIVNKEQGIVYNCDWKQIEISNAKKILFLNLEHRKL